MGLRTSAAAVWQRGAFACVSSFGILLRLREVTRCWFDFHIGFISKVSLQFTYKGRGRPSYYGAGAGNLPRTLVWVIYEYLETRFKLTLSQVDHTRATLEWLEN